MPRILAALVIAAAGVGAGEARAQTTPPEGPADCSPEGNVRFICGQAGPEDLVQLPGSEWVITSAFRGGGGLRLVNIRTHSATTIYPASGARHRLDRRTYRDCPGPVSGKATFQTAGLALGRLRNRVQKLYAVHHGERESIEVFDIDLRGRTPSATWVGCAVAPAGVGLNSVVALPDGSLAATNFLPPGDAGRAMFPRMREGANTGELWQWHPARGWAKIPGTEGSGLNGLAAAKDGRTFYVASWGGQSFLRFTRQGGAYRRDTIPLGFRADNLRWSPDGKILQTGHTDDSMKVVKIDPATLRLVEVIERKDTPSFAGGTSAIQVGKEIWVGSYRFNRIAIFPAGQ